MRGSEHLSLLNTEIWGLSTEHATAASETIKCAAQTNISQFTLMTSPHSVSCICDCYRGEHIIIYVIEMNWDQTTVHNDLTTNVICYQ